MQMLLWHFGGGEGGGFDYFRLDEELFSIILYIWGLSRRRGGSYFKLL